MAVPNFSSTKIIRRLGSPVDQHFHDKTKNTKFQGINGLTITSAFPHAVTVILPDRAELYELAFNVLEFFNTQAGSVNWSDKKISLLLEILDEKNAITTDTTNKTKMHSPVKNL